MMPTTPERPLADGARGDGALGREPNAAGTRGLPHARLCIAVTGHREDHAAIRESEAALGDALARLFALVDAASAAPGAALATPRLLCLLAGGTDLIAAEAALARGWEVAAPLPFGLALNIAVNSHVRDPADARALIAGETCGDAAAAARAARMRAVAEQIDRFELAEQDATVARLFTDKLAAPHDRRVAAAFMTAASERVAAAGRMMIEHADLLVAVWDGVAPAAIGGTRHTIAAALECGTPVLWIDATAPDRWRVLHAPESLTAALPAPPPAAIEALLRGLADAQATERGERALGLHAERWRPRSRRRFHAYRRIEALFGGGPRRFGGLVQRYEAPDAMAAGSAAPLLAAARALPGADERFVGRIAAELLGRFAWADGVSTYLSDAYRGGMVANFLLSALAIVAGVLYLPFSPDTKWPFASIELALLLAILGITAIGRRRRWHGRWFETRRVAEYLRHAPILLLLGVARAPGRWPRGSDTRWPEHYARLALRELGLPALVVTQGYLRGALETLLLPHATAQRDYHRRKARRLARVHQELDHASETMFTLAVVAVAAYLALAAASALGLVAEGAAHAASKSFTFLGVVFPALGGAFAGIRYFGDFERFAAISRVAADRLELIGERMRIGLADPARELGYAEIAALAHGLDDIVVAEIESWQAVFAGKQMAVPV